MPAECGARPESAVLPKGPRGHYALAASPLMPNRLSVHLWMPLHRCYVLRCTRPRRAACTATSGQRGLNRSHSCALCQAARLRTRSETHKPVQSTACWSCACWRAVFRGVTPHVCSVQGGYRGYHEIRRRAYRCYLARQLRSARHVRQLRWECAGCSALPASRGLHWTPVLCLQASQTSCRLPSPVSAQ